MFGITLLLCRCLIWFAMDRQTWENTRTFHCMWFGTRKFCMVLLSFPYICPQPHRESGGAAPPILKLGIRWSEKSASCPACFTPKGESINTIMGFHCMCYDKQTMCWTQPSLNTRLHKFQAQDHRHHALLFLHFYPRYNWLEYIYSKCCYAFVTQYWMKSLHMKTSVVYVMMLHELKGLTIY